jgi:hypothetical protein
MATTINISIYPFGSSREQIWIGKIVDGEFTKSHMLYKDTDFSKKKVLDGKFGKPSTRENWTIIVPDGYEGTIIKRRQVGQSTTRIQSEDCVLYHA